MQNRVYGLIGLAMKAGKIKAGEFSVEKSIKQGKAKLVFVAEDASENTIKKFKNSCFHYINTGIKMSWGRSSARKCVLLYL